jgi:hypothetical protein
MNICKIYKYLCAGIILATPGQASAALVFSEIMYNPASDPDNDWEWVELFNSGPALVDMTGYVIDDINSLAQTGSNLSGSIGVQSTAILFDADSISVADFTAAWGAGLNLIGVSGWSDMALNNDGDQISIWDSFTDYAGDNQSHSNAILTQIYDDASPWPSDDGVSSIYRPDLTSDPSDGANWSLTVAGLDGAFVSNPAGDNNATNVGSPGYVNPVPVPGAVWLFGTGIIGLIGFSKRKAMLNAA